MVTDGHEADHNQPQTTELEGEPGSRRQPRSLLQTGVEARRGQVLAESEVMRGLSSGGVTTKVVLM